MKNTILVGVFCVCILVLLGIAIATMSKSYQLKKEPSKDETKTERIVPTMLPTSTPSSVMESSLALTIQSPLPGTVVTKPSITIIGKTAENADVFINEKSTTADSLGNFSLTYALEAGENLILIVANDANGNAVEKELTVTYDVPEL